MDQKQITQMKASTSIPLVSVAVITYNSSEYVLETLESIKEQTYQNIELIVSDDASTDNTVELCKEWVENNKARFVRTKILTVFQNTGISANCNRAVRACNGEWIKVIAGDDALFPDAIEKVIDFLVQNPQISVLETNSSYYQGRFEEKNRVEHWAPPLWFFCEKITAQQQFRELLINGFLHAPSMFYKKDVFDKVGLFDERFKLIEDRPFWIKITKAGYKIYRFDVLTVKYRLHSKSVFSFKKEELLFNDFYKVMYDMYKIIIFPEVNWFVKFAFSWEYYALRFLDKMGLNKKKNTFLFRCFFGSWTPIGILEKMRTRRGNKFIKNDR
jgi:glycosyltransferase involved in cell wall biosynthesis